MDRIGLDESGGNPLGVFAIEAGGADAILAGTDGDGDEDDGDSSKN
jgi:hypothetical protein